MVMLFLMIGTVFEDHAEHASGDIENIPQII